MFQNCRQSYTCGRLVQARQASGGHPGGVSGVDMVVGRLLGPPGQPRGTRRDLGQATPALSVPGEGGGSVSYKGLIQADVGEYECKGEAGGRRVHVNTKVWSTNIISNVEHIQDNVNITGFHSWPQPSLWLPDQGQTRGVSYYYWMVTQKLLLNKFRLLEDNRSISCFLLDLAEVPSGL